MKIQPTKRGDQMVILHDYSGAVQAAVADLEKRGAAAKVWAKDPGLWKSDADHQRNIRQSLGWLTVTAAVRDRLSEITGFADEVRRSGFTHVLLLGMGGSSLCPDVLRLTFASAEGAPAFHLLDTTDPATIRAEEQAIDLPHTLIVVASKSGTTPEVNALQQYFLAKLTPGKGQRAGAQCVAITDPGTPLEATARAHEFRRIFFNPADIGGRYSALSYFGLVPAALMGIDLFELLERSQRMVHSCRAGVRNKWNPGLWLGAVMGSLALQGRNKVTIVCSKEIAAFGSWVEQLIAESTGKEGKGIVPVEGEPVGTPGRYGTDRLFIYLRLEGTRDVAVEGKLKRLAQAGHPLVTLSLQDRYDLGAEFFRWEFATAIAGAIIGVNPFDQPNVQESKDNTKQLLDDYKAAGSLPSSEPIFSDGEVQLYGDEATRTAIQGCRKLSTAVKAHLARARAGDYVALTAFLERNPETEKALSMIRKSVRDQFRVATTLGFGPRFLHSTGQLHKGGGDEGVVVQFTADDQADLPIPGEAYSFGIMKSAQALGDFQSLQRRQRRALRVHLGGNVKAGLRRLQDGLTRE